MAKLNLLAPVVGAASMSEVELESIAIQEAIDKVNKIIQEAEASGAKIAAWDEIIKILVDVGLAWESQTAPEFVGVHPQNRSTLGVGGAESHDLGKKILKGGFSWRKCADATAVEVDPLNSAEAESTNKDIVNLSAGMIPPLKQLKLLSIGGSHTNVFLRALNARAPTPISSLADAEGRLNTDAFAIKSSSLREAMTLGLKWRVLHHKCEKYWPKLVDFVQSGLNTEARGEQGEIEVMLAMRNMHNAAITSGKAPDWPKIQESVCHSMPPCAGYIAVLANYVKNNGGGPAGELLEELSAFQKGMGGEAAASTSNSKRILGPEFMQKLSSLNWGAGIKMPFVVNACIKANLVAPDDRVTEGIGVAKLITCSHLSQIVHKNARDQVKEAEALMADARKLAGALKTPDALRVRAIGKLDVRLVLHILKLGKVGEGIVFESMSEIAKACELHYMSR